MPPSIDAMRILASRPSSNALAALFSPGDEEASTKSRRRGFAPALARSGSRLIERLRQAAFQPVSRDDFRITARLQPAWRSAHT